MASSWRYQNHATIKNVISHRDDAQKAFGRCFLYERVKFAMHKDAVEDEVRYTGTKVATQSHCLALSDAEFFVTSALSPPPPAPAPSLHLSLHLSSSLTRTTSHLPGSRRTMWQVGRAKVLCFVMLSCCCPYHSTDFVDVRDGFYLG